MLARSWQRASFSLPCLMRRPLFSEFCNGLDCGSLVAHPTISKEVRRASVAEGRLI